MAAITGKPRVPFLDLGRRFGPLRGALAARLEAVVSAGAYVLGPEVAAFEAAFARSCGASRAVGVASGTDALRLALAACGVGPGDEVVTVSMTCAPTASAVLQTGAVPVLVDVDPRTLTMDPRRAEAALTARTKAIVPVHLYGQPADLGALAELARRKGLALVEDCAQAHGAAWAGRPAGSWGRAAAFSFYPTKNLGALGDGGAVVTSDPAVDSAVRRLRMYGYRAPDVAAGLGVNSRLDELQAAFLNVCLPLLPAWNARRSALAARYGAALAGSSATPPAADSAAVHAWHLYVVRHADRDGLRARLEARGVGSKVHYPVPVHRQEGYRQACRPGPGGLAATEAAVREVLSLPLYPELTDAEAAFAASAAREASAAC